MEQGSTILCGKRGLSLKNFLREVMCQAKISVAVVALWILFSIYYQKNLGTLKAHLGNACSCFFRTVNSHTVGSFSCHRAGTGPLVCAANGDGVWFSLDTPPWARPLQADTARLHQTAQLLFAESPLWHQMGCVETGRQPAFFCVSTSLQTALVYSYIIACLWAVPTEKIVGGTVS